MFKNGNKEKHWVSLRDIIQLITRMLSTYIERSSCSWVEGGLVSLNTSHQPIRPFKIYFLTSIWTHMQLNFSSLVYTSHVWIGTSTLQSLLGMCVSMQWGMSGPSIKSHNHCWHKLKVLFVKLNFLKCSLMWLLKLPSGITTALLHHPWSLAAWKITRHTESAKKMEHFTFVLAIFITYKDLLSELDIQLQESAQV